MEQQASGDIPVLFIEGRVLPEAWEKAVLAVWDKGMPMRTQYDRRGADGEFLDPPSRDATVMVKVSEPYGEPRVHRNFPGGPSELEVYRQEVVEGIHDHWIDPTDDKWTYTYHERLFDYQVTDDLADRSRRKTFAPVDQIECIVNSLLDTWYTRRAQAITWMPTADPGTYDPPCLQRIWCRLSVEDSGMVLNLNAHWRSRDLYKAWFMNAYALTDLQRLIAESIQERWQRPIRVGRYVDIADSLHIYGSYTNEIVSEIEKMRGDQDYRSRSWASDNPLLTQMIAETRQHLAVDPDFMKSS